MTEARPVTRHTRIMHGTVIRPVHPDGTRGRACIVHALSESSSFAGPGGLGRYVDAIRGGQPLFSLASATPTEAQTAADFGGIVDVSLNTLVRAGGCAWEEGRLYVLRLLSLGVYILEEVKP